MYDRRIEGEAKHDTTGYSNYNKPEALTEPHFQYVTVQKTCGEAVVSFLHLLKTHY